MLSQNICRLSVERCLNIKNKNLIDAVLSSSIGNVAYGLHFFCFFVDSGNNMFSQKSSRLCTCYNHCPCARPVHVGESPDFNCFKTVEDRSSCLELKTLSVGFKPMLPVKHHLDLVIWNMLICSDTLLLLKDQWKIERSSQKISAASAALVCNMFLQNRWNFQVIFTEFKGMSSQVSERHRTGYHQSHSSNPASQLVVFAWWNMKGGCQCTMKGGFWNMKGGCSS